MKNKKGFTLIELLIVIVLLVVITTGTVFGIEEISDRIKTKELNEITKMIESATEVYYSNNEVYRQALLNNDIKSRCTRLYVLQNADLLDYDLINPLTNKRIPANLCVNSYLNEEGIIVHKFKIN